MTEPIIITRIEVIVHAPGNCKYCGHIYEKNCCSNWLYCPACGYPNRDPLNKKTDDDKTMEK